MGKKWSEERKRKHSELVKAYWTDDKRKAKSDAMKEAWTEEKRAEKSESMTGAGNHMYGKTRNVSNDTKRKLSKSLTGKRHSDETKKKIGLAHTGMVRSTTTRKRISEAKKGTVTSVATKKLLSIRGKERYTDPEERRKTGERSKQAWQNPSTREALLSSLRDPVNIEKRNEGTRNFKESRPEEYRESRKRQANTILARLENPDYYEQRYGDDFKALMSEQAKIQWADPDIKKKMRKSLKQAWQNSNREERIANLIKIATSFKHCKQGYHHSPKAGKVHYRSSYELAFYHILDSQPEVSTYEVETISIPYNFNNTTRTYIPDVKVIYTDGDWEVVEIKPEAFLDAEENAAKFQAAEKEFGQHFVVVTESEIF